jgi:ribosomal protein S18 acetylase RimI-like enzyme
MTDVETPIHVRAAHVADLDDLGRMAGQLVRYHHALDPQRFMLMEGVERGYAHFFASQLDDADTVLLVAERAGACIGYTYARLESRDWNALLDACGALHDIFVDEAERKNGVATLLLDETVKRLTERGAPRVVLHTATQNAAAQRLFARHGFRATMFEMTRELP